MKKWMKVCTLITFVCVLIALFFGLGGMEYINRNTQSGVAYLSVFYNDELLSADEYVISSELKNANYKNGYKFDIVYGEVCGKISLFEQYEIEFGFINTNNWHNVQIRLDVKHQNDKLMVTQTISYATDNNVFEVIVTEETTSENTVSVFQNGV